MRMLRSETGFTLMGLMVQVGVSAVIMAAVAQFFLMNEKFHAKYKLKEVAISLRSTYSGIIMNKEALKTTIVNPVNSATFGCILNSTDCTDAGGTFVLFDHENQRVINPSIEGLTADGIICNGFNTISGNDLCPIVVTLTWSPICTVVACVKPKINISAKFEYFPYTPNTKQSINFHRFDINVIFITKDIATTSIVALGIVGLHSTYVLYSDGKIKAFGATQAASAPLGIGADRGSVTPKWIVDSYDEVIDSAVQMGTGLSAHMCILLANGQVLCAGRGNRGGMGDGIVRTAALDNLDIFRFIPAKTENRAVLSNVIKLSGGVNSGSMALTSAGQIYSWGANTNNRFALGGGNGDYLWATPSTFILLAAGLPDILDINLRQNSACAIIGGAFNSNVTCWGRDSEGHSFGNDQNDFDPHAPTLELSHQLLVPGESSDGLRLENVTLIRSSQTNFSCVLLADGRAACWGLNNSGQLGNETLLDGAGAFDLGGTEVPLYVKDGSGGGDDDLVGIVDISVGRDSACAVVVNGKVTCWGANQYLQLGRAEPSSFIPRAYMSIPVIVQGIDNAIKVECGWRHCCAITSLAGNQEVKCWGNNSSSQLGRSGGQSSVPTSVTGL